jgi:hypothetical protein
VSLEEAQATVVVLLRDYYDFVDERAKREHEESAPARREHARAVRWWQAYTAVLNASHLAGASVEDAHKTACEAAALSAGAMPEEYKVPA